VFSFFILLLLAPSTFSQKFKLYKAPHALNAEATRDRISFLARQLSFKPPDAKAVATIPALIQPPWPKPSN